MKQLRVSFLLSCQWVFEKYENGGWVQHHEHLLEYDECTTDHSKPSITVRVAKPADDDERKWKVSIISTRRVSCTDC